MVSIKIEDPDVDLSSLKLKTRIKNITETNFLKYEKKFINSVLHVPYEVLENFVREDEGNLWFSLKVTIS